MGRWYEVEMIGEAREVYSVYAESEDEAIDNWFNGDLVHYENTGMGYNSIYSELDEDEDEGQ